LSVSPFTDPVINLAILFHDFGKATTRGEKEGQSTYHGHEEAGVPIVENIFKRLVFNDLSAEDKKNILQAVAKHMLVHNLDNLNIKTLSRLILDSSWNIVKSVAYCDEASRGLSHFNKKQFEEKIKRAEEKVSNLGGDSEDLRKRIKHYIDGGKLIQWYPELYQKPKLGILLKKAQDHVLELLNSNQEPNDEEIKKYIDSVFNESFISSFKNYLLEKYKRMSAGMDEEDIAKKDKVPVSTIEKQIKMGKRVEKEHGVNIKKAKRIAMDHLAENPKYYTKLKKAKL
jgi:hypothetical protein